MGVLALGALPGGVAASRYSERVDLVPGSAGGVVAGFLLGILAVLLARRARWRIQRTLGRSRGTYAARVGRALGLLGLFVALTGALALGFFGLLQLFAR